MNYLYESRLPNLAVISARITIARKKKYAYMYIRLKGNSSFLKQEDSSSRFVRWRHPGGSKIYFIFSHQADFILCLRTLAVKRRHRQQRRRIVMQKIDTVYTQKRIARFNIVTGALIGLLIEDFFPRSLHR